MYVRNDRKKMQEVFKSLQKLGPWDQDSFHDTILKPTYQHEKIRPKQRKSAQVSPIKTNNKPLYSQLPSPRERTGQTTRRQPCQLPRTIIGKYFKKKPEVKKVGIHIKKPVASKTSIKVSPTIQVVKQLEIQRKVFKMLNLEQGMKSSRESKEYKGKNMIGKEKRERRKSLWNVQVVEENKPEVIKTEIMKTETPRVLTKLKTQGDFIHLETPFWARLQRDRLK